jgi:peptidoglycan recognition protein
MTPNTNRGPMTRIIPRSEWVARHGRGGDASQNLPWGEVVIHTEAAARSATANPATEDQWVRNVEHYHAVTLGWQGIGYSFVIAPSGRLYEGRGWGRSGAHTETRNSTAAGVCFLGHGDQQPATPAQWASAKWLIGEGVRLGHLRSNPTVTGHRNYSRKGKSCPGNLIYPHIDQLRGITGPPTAAPPRTPAPPEPRPPLPKETHPLMALTDSEQKALAGDARGALAAALRTEAQATQARAAAQRADLRTEHITALLQKVLTGDSFDAKQAKLFDARVRKELAEVIDRLEAELADLRARHTDAK